MRRLYKILKLSFDRSFSSGVWNQLLWLLSFIIVTGIILWQFRPVTDTTLTFEIAQDTIPNLNNEFSVWKLLELYIDQGNFNGGNISDEFRIYGLIVTLVGALFFGSALISVLSNMLNVRVEKFRSGNVNYTVSKHVLIIGYHKMIPSLIRQFNTNKEFSGLDIVILTSSDVDEIRHRLHSVLNKEEERKVIIIHGRQTAEEDLAKVCVSRAKRIYLLGEEKQYDHDAISIESLKQIAAICKKSKRKEVIICETLIEYQTTYSLFKNSGVLQEISEYIQFSPFSFEEVWSYRIFVTCEYENCDLRKTTYTPLDQGLMTIDSEQNVHLVIIGMSKMGIAIAKQAALVSHYPNFISKGIKTKISLIDTNAYQEMLHFVGGNPELFEESEYTYRKIEDGQESINQNPNLKNSFLDVEWEFIEGRAESHVVRELLKEWSKDANQLLTIAICINFSPSSIAIGLYLPREVYENNVQILINQQSSDSIIEILDAEKYRNVKPFGMLNVCCDLGHDQLLQKAKIVNYIYDYYYNNNEIPSVVINQKALDALWLKLTISKKWSNIYNACTITTKLRSMGLDKINSFDWCITEMQYYILANMEHNRWNVEELMLGYRTATSEEKSVINMDPIQKSIFKKRFIHYDIRPFDELQNDEQGLNVNRYDYALVKSLHLLVDTV